MPTRVTSVLALTALVWGSPLSALASNDSNAEETWVNIQGEVAKVRPESFVLDHGYGQLRIDMDRLDDYPENFKLQQGDEVNITGRLDASFHSSQFLQASSIYVDRLGAFFYKTGNQARNGGEWAVDTDVGEGTVTMIGTVQSVNHAAARFVINSGDRKLLVTTDTLPYNPLDEKGYRRIEEGARVRVEGRLDERFFDEGQLKAIRITRLEG